MINCHEYVKKEGSSRGQRLELGGEDWSVLFTNE